MPTVSIIITNWNGQKWLAGCFQALEAQTYPDFEIILVDDGSTDGSADWVAENYPAVRLIRQAEHLGFAGANNVGIRAAEGRYIVALNNDTRPEPAWLAEMVAGLTGPDIGMVAAQILIWDDPSLLDSAGIEVDWAGFGWNRGWRQPVHTANKPEEVFGPCAAAALYRREMLAEIGLFDEDYYTYYEDVDLAWRARRAGWRCWYMPTARLLHHHSATGGRGSPRKIFFLSRNKIYTILKNYSWFDLFWAWPLLLGYDILSALFQLIHTRSLAPVRGRWQAIRSAPRMLARRKKAARRVWLALPRLSRSA